MPVRKQYLPATFCQRWGSSLAPSGTLIPPTGIKDEDLKGVIVKALKDTIRDMEEQRNLCVECLSQKVASDVTMELVLEMLLVSSDDLHECSSCKMVKYCDDHAIKLQEKSHAEVCKLLKQEDLDQVVECFPSPLNLPSVLKSSKWSKTASTINNWEQWFCINNSLQASVLNGSRFLNQWLSLSGRQVSVEEIQKSLKRIVSGLFSTALTIGKTASQYGVTKKKIKRKDPIKIHLIGADKPEVSLIGTRLYKQLEAMLHPLRLQLFLVSPDPANKNLSATCSLEKPLLLGDKCEVVSWCGLYHDFWEQVVAPNREQQTPDVALCIHPGLHAEQLIKSWTPTLLLLRDEGIPTTLTTYNHMEHEATLNRIETLDVNIVASGKNPFSSLHVKQTPCELDKLWASNSYLITLKGKKI